MCSLVSKSAATPSDGLCVNMTVYQINPSSPSPLSVHDTGTHLPIIGGVYVPGNTCGEGNYDSREVALYFMDSSQVSLRSNQVQ